MLNKKRKVVCNHVRSKYVSVNRLLLTMCGLTLTLVYSFFSTDGKAADKGEIIFKSTLERPDCTVNAPSSINLTDVVYPAAGNNVGNVESPFDISIDCNNSVSVTSYITIGTSYPKWANSEVQVLNSSGDVLPDFRLGLICPEADDAAGNKCSSGTHFAYIGDDSTPVFGTKYCEGDTDRKCRFQPVVKISGSSDFQDPKYQGEFSWPLTFYLNYV